MRSLSSIKNTYIVVLISYLCVLLETILVKIMSHSNNTISEQPNNVTTTTRNGGGSSELKLYQAFLFPVPIFFTFVLLFLFYFFYLRRRRVDWSSLRMRTTTMHSSTDLISTCELGLKKELREMLPIVIFKESFYVNDTQCSVCLGDFQAEEKLQQLPGCGHTFHMECIDLWLSTHSTCPLCRHSLITVTTKPPPSTDQLVVIVPTSIGSGNDDTSSLAQIGDDQTFLQNDSQSNGRGPQTSLHDSSSSESMITDERVAAPSVSEGDDQDIHLNQHV